MAASDYTPTTFNYRLHLTGCPQMDCGITDFRWHDLRHTWASWLRQNDVPTWVLQELGGWKSESMVRRYAHMSVKHLQPYADQLIFRGETGYPAEPRKTAEAYDTKSPTLPGKTQLYVVK